MILLLGVNIFLYNTHQEYRFFIKKIKYPESIIYEEKIHINDSLSSLDDDTLTLENTLSGNIQNSETQDEILTLDDDFSQSTLQFLESLSKQKDDIRVDDEPQEKHPAFLKILEILSSYQLEEKTEDFLFDITPEYPDAYLHLQSQDVSVYHFYTKTYRDVYDIFDVLQYDLPISLNIVNNFWDRSFFINMDDWWEDERVRIVFEYENEVFWLKIKKDLYNSIRESFQAL